MDNLEFTQDDLLADIRLLPPDNRARFLREWGLLNFETCPKDTEGAKDFSSHTNLHIATMIWGGDEPVEEGETGRGVTCVNAPIAEVISFGDEVLIELSQPVQFSSRSFSVGLFPRGEVHRWFEVLLGREECPPPVNSAGYIQVKIGFPYERTYWALIDEVRHYLWPLVEGRPAADPILPPPSPQYVRTNPDPERFMSTTQWDNAFAGISFANWSGLIFNVELTVSWSKLGLTDDADIKRGFEIFLKRSRSWHKERNLEPMMWWVWERSDKVGLHTHFGLVLPAEHRGDPRMRRAGQAMRREFAGFQDWLVATLGRLSPTREMSPAEVIDSSAFDLAFRTKATVMSQWKWFAYCSKSLHPGAVIEDLDATTDTIRLTNVSSVLRLLTRPSVAIPCDRAGASIAIGPGARSKAGYHSPLDQWDFPVDQFFSDRELRRGKLEREMRERDPSHIVQAIIALQALDRRRDW